MSINDIRRMENLPPVAGGDIYLQPLNMADARMPQPGNQLAGQPARATDKQIAAIEAMLS
jgi:hypothetical protein